jgi:hypothetical protein
MAGRSRKPGIVDPQNHELKAGEFAGRKLGQIAIPDLERILWAEGYLPCTRSHIAAELKRRRKAGRDG